MNDFIPLEIKPEGLYCPPGNFFIDAWRPVALSLITHAHGDHAYRGHQHYLSSEDSRQILEHRLGAIPLQSLPYGEKIKIGETWVSFHPAGHILGSSQIRIETNQSVTVISGDYKRAYDTSCQGFEVIECDTFVTESTFALPIYRWKEGETIAEEIFQWWQTNQQNQHPSIIFCYSLGKAQRVLALLQKLAPQPIFLHGAIHGLSQIYANKGIQMAPFKAVTEKEKGDSFQTDLILAPPSALGTPWLKRFPNYRAALASGWMQVRGTRKRKNLDKGFVLSDHADWNDLIRTVKDTKAKNIFTTHGYSGVLAQYLKEELALNAHELKGLETHDEGEEID